MSINLLPIDILTAILISSDMQTLFAMREVSKHFHETYGPSSIGKALACMNASAKASDDQTSERLQRIYENSQSDEFADQVMCGLFSLVRDGATCFNLIRFVNNVERHKKMIDALASSCQFNFLYLEKLDFGEAAGKASLEYMGKQLTQVTRLFVHVSEKEELQDLAQWENLNKLTIVLLKNSAQNMGVCMNFKKLNQLELRGAEGEDIFLDSTWINSLTTINHLSLYYININDNFSINLESIKHLTLFGIRYFNKNNFKELKNLTQLSLHHSNFNARMSVADLSPVVSALKSLSEIIFFPASPWLNAVDKTFKERHSKLKISEIATFKF